MPGFDGTGPLGEGPMTGRDQGFCVLTNSKANPGQVKGIAGLQGVPVGQINRNYENYGKEVINMPRGDKTGPAGAGPMTGRGAGFCVNFGVPGYANPVGGRGMGMGRGNRMGRGRGFGRGFGFNGAGGPYPTPQNLTADQELEALKGQADYFANSISQSSNMPLF